MSIHRGSSGRSGSRRLSDIFFSGPSNPSRSASRTSSVHGSIDRPSPHSESSLFHSNSPTIPSRRLTTFIEVVDEVTETEDPGQTEQVDSEKFSMRPESHQRIPHVQAEGRRLLDEFKSHSKALEQDLQKFQDAVQGLGSSLDLARAARSVRECLSATSWLIQENASKLFPLAVKAGEPPHMDAEYIPEQRHRPHWPPTPASQSKISHSIRIVPIYVELNALAESIGNLSGELEQFPEFDNFRKQPLRYFEGDLKYWSSCLQSYEGHFDLREVQTYIHDLSVELGKQFEDSSRCVVQYIACVPTVRLAQKHAFSNLQTMATIATFFSAVTATTIQYSIGSPSDPTNKVETLASQAANAFWFSSLVFSIASALNSSLALMWRSAIYSSPQHRIPLWLWLWIRQCPTMFLLVSVVTFLAGLGCFAVSSQPHAIWIVVLVCEGVSSFSLAALLLWLAADKWRLQLQRPSSFRLNQFLRVKTGNVLPTHVEHTASWSAGYLDHVSRVLSSITARFKLSLWWPFSRASSVIPESPTGYSTREHTPQPSPRVPRRSSSLPTAQQRWRLAIRKVILLSRATTAAKEWDFLESERMTDLQGYLRKIAGSVEDIRHEAGTKTSGLQFSPAGDSLAICGKLLSMCYDLGSSKKDNLRHRIGQARQVIWTTSGEYLLTRTNRAVHVWSLSGEMSRKTIIRHETTGFILGIPDIKVTTGSPGVPPKFISIEGGNMNKIAIIDVRGEEHSNHEFGNISIKHADVVPDGSCMLLAAEVSQTPDGLRPMKVSPTRKLMVLNLKSRKIEHEVPLWHNAQSVAISGNGQMAIVTYKANPPPQLWRLRRTPEGIRLSLERQFCARERVSAHEFDPLKHIQFSGKGHFLNNDRFVLCATTEGKIHFWRRDKSDPVFVFEGLTEDNDKPIQVECNRTSEDFMFATRSQDGTVRVWRARDAPPKVIRVDTNGLQPGVMDHPASHTLSESPLTEMPEESEAQAEGGRGNATPPQ